MSRVSNPTTDFRVLWTRPEGRGDDLLQMMQQVGFHVVHFPVIQIADPFDLSAFSDALNNLQRYDLAIFVSVTAVQKVGKRLRWQRRTQSRFPDVAVVGKGTAKDCLRYDLPVRYCPKDDMSSEGLLKILEGIDLVGKGVVIFRGQQGRGLLESELQNRGVKVDSIECYRRIISRRPFRPTLLEWKDKGIDVIVITSVSILDGLLRLMGESNKDLFKKTIVITISKRIAKVCRESGIENVVVAATPEAKSMMVCLKRIKNRK